MAESSGPPTVRIIVMDTGPLITLAAADSLDYLTAPGVPVHVPDAVMFEATVKEGALGARAIVAWAQKNMDRVHVVPTQVNRTHQLALLIDPSVKTPDLGERAAIEVAHEAFEPGPGDLAVLLTEDGRAARIAREYDPEGPLVAMTTRDFLDGLEEAGRINSADEVYRKAEEMGRRASQALELEREERTERIDAVRRMIARPQG